MSALTFHFEVVEGFDAESVAAEVGHRLEGLEGVDQSESEVEDERGLLEAVAVISAIVTLTKAATEGTEALTKFVASLRALIEEVDGLAGAVLDIAGRKVSLDDPEAVVAALESGD